MDVFMFRCFGGDKMVKIPLTSEQIVSLFEWRDKNRDLVRRAVIPFPNCEITNGMGIKIRVKQKDLNSSVYLFTVSDTVSNTVMGRFSYLTYTGLVHHWFPVLEKEGVQDCISIWGTVMAYILNFEPKFIPPDEEQIKEKSGTNHKATQRKRKQPKNSVLYLNPIKYITGAKNQAQRKYTAPSVSFSVRGHYRNTRYGKVVYVHPYEKYTGKEKDKRNKIVKITEV